MKHLIFIFLSILFFVNSQAQKPVKIWETDSVFSGPESVVYDPIRDILYVSNFRKTRTSDIYYGKGFISRVKLSGEIKDLKWIDQIMEPTGICIFNDQLYVAERFGVVIIDLKTEKIEKRIRINTQGFLNDITVGNDSTIYVSESNTMIVHAIKNKTIYQWMNAKETNLTNGVLFDKDKLLLAVNADSSFKAVDIKTRNVTKIAQLPKGILDGIKTIGNDYLVSIFEGSLYHITKDGKVNEILNTRSSGTFLADFEYIESKKLLIVPTLWNNKVFGYKLE